MVLTLILLVVIVAAYWLRWRYNHRKILKAAEQFPGPKALPGLGNALMLIGGTEVLVMVLKQQLENYGLISKIWLGPELNIIIGEPDQLKNLLANPKMNYKGPQYQYMKDAIGEGILSGSGPTWRKHRKIANPNYGKRAVEFYSKTFNKEVGLLLQTFRSLKDEEQYDLSKYIVQSTSYTVCQTLMGLTREQTMNIPYLQEVIDGTPTLYDIIMGRMTIWYLQIDPVFWLSKQNQLQKRFIHMFKTLSAEVVKCRREHLNTLGDVFKAEHMEMKEDTSLSVIDRFILSNSMDEKELLQETFTIFTSSQEPTAKISSNLLLMLAYHPDCQEKLYNEILTVIGDSDRDVTDEDIKHMPYLEMVFKEIIRMFPIGAILQRQVTEDIPLSSGQYLPAGASVVIPIYHLHRYPRYWKDPDAFDPERFTVENSEKRHPYAYLPFSLGPMDCLGRFFGIKLVKTLCVRVLREFEVTSLQSFKDFRVAISISAISADGYFAKLTPRPKRSK